MRCCAACQAAFRRADAFFRPVPSVTVPRSFRCRAADRACFESTLFDAALRPSRFNAFVTARDRFAEAFLFRAPV